MPGLTAEALRLAVATATDDQPVLIDDFLYEKDVLMIAGDPGVGKSVVLTQLALHLTGATSAYGFLPIPVPKRVYYLQLEGKPEQAYERIRRMAGVVSWEPTRLLWDARKGLNVLDLRQVQGVLTDIASWGGVDVVIIDPIYKVVFGPLGKEEPTQALIRFSDLLQTHFGCAVILSHHTHRPGYGSDGKKIEEEDPFYGSQWLKAHVDSSYHLKHPGGKYKDRVTLYNKKTRGNDVIRELLLHYDPETDTLSTDAPIDKQSAYERAVKFLAECRQTGRQTDAYEMQEVLMTSMRHVMRIQQQLLEKGHVRCDKLNGKKRIWEPIAFPLTHL